MDDKHEQYCSKVFDELYSQYITEQSMKRIQYNHPMFYNGTFSENNEYQPKEPESDLIKEEFINKINSDNDNSKWCIGFEILYMYLHNQDLKS